MIFLDKPFQIGDWIVGGGVEGTVEEVGFRSSRIRAADTSIFTIPNSKLSEIVINNKGLRKYRRYKTVLGIRYDTPPELIEAFVKGVRQIIEVHPRNPYRVVQCRIYRIWRFGASGIGQHLFPVVGMGGRAIVETPFAHGHCKIGESLGC